MRVILCTLLLLLMLPAAMARVEVQQFATPQQEARYKKLINELRCLVCQNQNLADSNADLARQLRDITYNMIRDGKSDEEIIRFMVQRYGEFVLYRPPVTDKTVVLWAGPFILLLLAVLILFAIIRRNKNQAVEPPARDLAHTRRLLEGRGQEQD